MSKLIRLGPAILGFIVGMMVSACEKDDSDDELDRSCSDVIVKSDTCYGLAWEGCDGCIGDCADRGRAVAAEDEHCGELWADAYACIAALPCDQYNVWREVGGGTSPYPCDAEELAFREECPGFPLHNDEE